MDINLLALNVGNTRLAVGAFVAGELRESRRADVADDAAIAAAVEACAAHLREVASSSAAGGSVNPRRRDAVAALVARTCGLAVEWVGDDLDLPMPVRTQTPAETGADRILNLAAAFEQHRRACVVVDAGTAITVDVCDDAGAFLGGAIAPGLGMMLDALHERTAKLPRVAVAEPSGPWGDSTSQAILHGAVGGARGMVRHLVEQYATALGHWPKVLATGGDAALLFADGELVDGIEPDLTLYGVAAAFAEHHIRHGT